MKSLDIQSLRFHTPSQTAPPFTVNKRWRGVIIIVAHYFDDYFRASLHLLYKAARALPSWLPSAERRPNTSASSDHFLYAVKGDAY